jgi:hypothetical protein
VKQVTVNPVLLDPALSRLQIDANCRRATRKPGGVIVEYSAAQNVGNLQYERCCKLPIRSLPVVFGNSDDRECAAPPSAARSSECRPAAGDTRLGHFEQTGPDPVAIANARLVVGEALDGEVLAELSKGEVATPELILPMAIGGNLIEAPSQILLTIFWRKFSRSFKFALQFLHEFHSKRG